MSLQNTLRALAAPTRRELLELLRGGSKSAGELADHFDNCCRQWQDCCCGIGCRCCVPVSMTAGMGRAQNRPSALQMIPFM